jgi:hypothetical protein
MEQLENVVTGTYCKCELCRKPATRFCSHCGDYFCTECFDNEVENGTEYCCYCKDDCEE